MDEQSFPSSDQVNMHVKGGMMHVDLDTWSGMPRELTEKDIATQKSAVRALLVARLEKIWQVCEPHIDNALGLSTDVRMTELALKVIDRLAKLHEVTLPDRGLGEVGDEATITLARRQEILKGLTERRAHLDGEMGD